jgi:NADP-dependent 3-hydroxy acid dehydrogenase YdfG
MRMSADIPRPRALITGASRGIGAATARALAPTHDVWLGGRDETALMRLAAELPGARPWPVDLTDAAAMYAATAGIDTLDVLVHSAGIAEIGRLPATSVEVWRRTMEINVIAVAELTRLLLPALRATRGRVVLVNSGQGRRPSAGWGAYAVSKFALTAYATVLRAEEEPGGLRVTTVFPGRTDTDMQRGVRAAEVEAGEYDPSRYLRPESVAESIRFVVTGPADAAVPELVIVPSP